MLTFPIKKKWFDMLETGEKGEEYRDDTPYYRARLEGYLGTVQFIKFRNGYSKTSPYIIIEVEVTRGTGRAEWGAPAGWRGFVLKRKDYPRTEVIINKI